VANLTVIWHFLGCYIWDILGKQQNLGCCIVALHTFGSTKV